MSHLTNLLPNLSEEERRKQVLEKNSALVREKAKEHMEKERRLKKLDSQPRKPITAPTKMSIIPLGENDIKETREFIKEKEVVKEILPVSSPEEENIIKDGRKGSPKKTKSSYKSIFKYFKKNIIEFIGPLFLTILFTALAAFGSDYAARRVGNPSSSSPHSPVNVPEKTNLVDDAVAKSREYGTSGSNLHNGTRPPPYNIFR